MLAIFGDEIVNKISTDLKKMKEQKEGEKVEGFEEVKIWQKLIQKTGSLEDAINYSEDIGAYFKGEAGK